MRPKSFLFLLAPLMAILFGITAIPFALFTEKQLRKALVYSARTEVTRNVQRLGAVLEHCVRHRNTAQIEKVFHTYMNNPSLLGIVLYDPQGTVIASIRRTEAGDFLPLGDLLFFRSTLPRESYSINNSLFHEGVFEGRVETYVDITPSQQQTRLFRTTLFYTLSFLAAFLILLLLLLLHGLLGHPLRKIRQDLDSFMGKNTLSRWRHQARIGIKENAAALEDCFEHVLPENNRLLQRKDEIGQLSASLQQLLGYTYQEISRQEKNMESLEENNTRLIEELCLLRQHKIEMEQYIREMGKKIRLLEEQRDASSEGNPS